MSSSPPAGSDEAQIRACIENWAAAVRSKDLDRLLRDYAPEVYVCDLRPPLRYTGAERYRQNCAGWFSGWVGPIDCQVTVEQLHIGGDLAMALCLTHNRGTQAGGEPADLRLRATVGFRKLAEGWKVIHEHLSVPLDMETGRPLFDLQP